MSRKTHLIIGDGITALAFLEKSAQRADLGEIVLVGRSVDQFGRGAAYARGDWDAPWRYAYLLNSPADDIDPSFAQWLKEKWPEIQDIMAGRRPDWLAAAAPLVAAGDVYGVNAPREFYGDYMEEHANDLIARLSQRGVTVTRITDLAERLEVSEDQIKVTTQSGREITAHSLDVAPGGPSTLRIPGDQGAFSAPSVFGHEARIAEFVRRGVEIFCVGGNAAMLDVLRLCQSVLRESDLRFVACAPDGAIPAALVPRLPRKLTEPRLSSGHQTAQSFLTEVSQEIDRAKSSGDEMREIRAGFRAHFLAHPLTEYITETEEAKKVPAKLRFWLRGGTRDTIADMHRLVERGKARMVTGKVRAVESHADGAVVRVESDAGARVEYATGFVINCAGAGPTSSYDPLTTDMLRQGLIRTCDISRGLVVGSGCTAGSDKVRYLSPAVSQIGDEVMAMPLYDAHMLRTYVERSGR